MPSVPEVELDALCRHFAAAMNRTRSKLGLEIGVHHGYTTRAMSRFLYKLDRNARWIGVDYKLNIPYPIPYDNVTLHMMRSDELAQRQPHLGPFALIFVDGCHCRACVEKDIELWADRVPPGGIMAFHDARESTEGAREYPYHEGDLVYAVHSTIFSHPVLSDLYVQVESVNDGRLEIFRRKQDGYASEVEV